MDQYSDEHIFSEKAELAIGFLVSAFIIGLIILHLFAVGPIGSNTAASHAGAGFGEIFLILGIICLGTTVTFTRFVYRSWPQRWLKVASVLYMLLLLLWVGLGFIESGGALLMIFFQVLGGLALSVIMMANCLVTRMRP